MKLIDRMLEAHRFWITVKGTEVVDAQQDFPNCGKYTKCCTDDAEFWEKYGTKVKELFKETRYRKQPFRTKPSVVQNPAPKEFENFKPFLKDDIKRKW